MILSHSGYETSEELCPLFGTLVRRVIHSRMLVRRMIPPGVVPASTAGSNVKQTRELIGGTVRLKTGIKVLTNARQKINPTEEEVAICMNRTWVTFLKQLGCQKVKEKHQIWGTLSNDAP